MPSFPSRLVRALLTVILCLLAGLAGAANWTVSVDNVQGLPLITKGGAPAVKVKFAFWGTNWGWADLTTQFSVLSSFNYAVTGRNATLGFDLADTVRRTADNQLTWDFDLNAGTAKSNVIGGGVTFIFDQANFGAEMGLPTVLPNRDGWTWGKPGGNRLEMRFSPAPASVFVEPTNKNEIRVYFYNGSVPAGHTRHTATLTLAGDMALLAALPERFGLDDPTTWPSDIMDWRTSPVDLSFLNQPEIPAGKHGFLRAVRDQLVFQDGTVARFWGTNVSAYALYNTPNDFIRSQARRISQLGFNLVRIHHHDSPWVNPNIFGPTTNPNTLTLSPAQLDKLDWWIKCLKDEGVYVWLDMHVMRYFKPGDNIDFYDEIAQGRAETEVRGYTYVNPSLQRAMRDFARAYLGHRNSYTGLAYKDDPAIMAVLLTNENDVTTHFGSRLLPDKGVPRHSALYMAAADQFATTWGLSREATWHSWEYGPAKLFLNDLEYRFNSSQISDLRTFGLKVPIATTNSWGNDPLAALPSLTSGSVVDAHVYGTVAELDKNPFYAASFVNWVGAAQVAGKPLTLTEWNVETFPVPDRHSAPLLLASAAALQGWDALMQYAYSQASLNSVSGPSNWHAYSDPSLIATLPAAALLYRQGHVRESETVYAFTPTTGQLFSQNISPANSVALRTAMEKGKLVIAMPATRELPWLQASTVPRGAILITDPQRSLLPAGATAATSDTGQLRHDWGQGIYTIITPRTQAAMGWLGGKTVQLPDVTITLSTRNASVAVQTLDGRPVSTSRNLMISLGARSVPAAPTRMPFYSEPVVGRLTIRGPTGLRLYKRLSDGTQQQLPVIYSGGSYVLNLDASLRTYWLLLKG